MTTTATSGSPGDPNDGSPRRAGFTTLRRGSSRRRAQKLLSGGLVVGLVLVMAACSRSSGGASGGSSTTAGSGTSSGAPFNGQFGSLTTPVCGPMPSPAPTPTKAQVGATSGINVKGVTASSIRVGTISDTG